MDEVRKALQVDAARVDGSGVRVAVIDTGIDADHPDLQRCLRRDLSKSFYSQSDELADRHGHGTHIAGIIAGDGSTSDSRFRGLAPGVELVALRVAHGVSALSGDVVAAVFHAVEIGAHIINYSAGRNAFAQAGGPPPWKWPTRRSALEEAFAYASNKGILCIAAAGNDGPDEGSVVSPGIMPEVLCVGGTAPPTYQVADQSSRGPVYWDEQLPRGAVGRLEIGFEELPTQPKPDIVVPGCFGVRRHDAHRDPLLPHGIAPGGVVSTRSRTGLLYGLDPADPSAPYAMHFGTSQSTAVATGLAALLLCLGESVGMDWGDNQGTALREIIKDAARPLPTGSIFDYGCGTVLWPNIVATLDDCLASPLRRETVLRGRQLRLALPDDLGSELT